MDEKFCNKLLAIFTAFSISIITLFCFFCIGLSRVEANSYRFEYPYRLQFNNSLVPFEDVVQGCNYTNTCGEEEGVWGSNYISSLYSISANLENEDTTIKTDTYRVNYTAVVSPVGNPVLTKPTRALFYYYTGSDSWNHLATCDGGEKFGWAKTSEEPALWIFSYTCETFQVTNSNITHFAISFGNANYLLDWVSIETGLTLIGPGEATNEDIINNQNQNTQDIINNQNNNQQQTNQGLQDIEDTLTDETAPNLDAFNDMAGWLPPGPLDSVLNLPLSVLNGLVGVFSDNTCSPISIPIPFIGGTLDLPCLYSLYTNINGLSVALTTFFTAIAGYLMFKYLSNLYVWIDKTLKMEESSYMQDWGGV